MREHAEGEEGQRLKLQRLMVKLRIIQQQRLKLVVATVGGHFFLRLTTRFCLIAERDVRQRFPAEMLRQGEPGRAYQHGKEQEYGNNLAHNDQRL